MSVKWLLHPKTGEPLTFEEAPELLEREGVMPSYAVEAIVREFRDGGPAFHVRPSDVRPSMSCRRQRVWESLNDYGVNPLEREGMLEGSAFHSQLGAHEIEVPEPVIGRVDFDEVPQRIAVCGVLMRGRIDWLFPDRIEDLKTSTPYWIVKYGAKGSGIKPWCEIWHPKDEDDVAKWQLQLSLYRALLQKSGQDAPAMGRVWRRYSGVKADKPRWRRFDFPLMDETELERVVGEWMRSLGAALREAEAGNQEAWKLVPADGREFVGSRGNMWACDRCQLRSQCEAVEGWSGF